jgi:molecular chaperone DnaK (HSP70)
MSVCGLDFGNLSMLIAQTSKGGVDVLLNDASNRQTATAVSIQGKQRFLGDAGASMVSYTFLAPFSRFSLGNFTNSIPSNFSLVCRVAPCVTS